MAGSNRPSESEAQRSAVSMRSEVSRVSDAEMRELMREIVNRLYTFQLRLGEEEFRDYLDRQLTSTRNWDEPRLDWNLAGRTLREAAGPDAAEHLALRDQGTEPR